MPSCRLQANGGPDVTGTPISFYGKLDLGLLGGDAVVENFTIPAGLGLRDVVAPHDRTCLVPQRQAGQVLEQDLLCLVELGVCLVGGLAGKAFLEELVELG